LKEQHRFVDQSLGTEDGVCKKGEVIGKKHTRKRNAPNHRTVCGQPTKTKRKITNEKYKQGGRKTRPFMNSRHYGYYKVPRLAVQQKTKRVGRIESSNEPDDA
jgi:hypothetical protein